MNMITMLKLVYYNVDGNELIEMFDFYTVLKLDGMHLQILSG